MSATHRRHRSVISSEPPEPTRNRSAGGERHRGWIGKGGEAQRARLARASATAASTSRRARFSALVGRGANSSKILVKTSLQPASMSGQRTGKGELVRLRLCHLCILSCGVHRRGTVSGMSVLSDLRCGVTDGTVAGSLPRASETDALLALSRRASRSSAVRCNPSLSTHCHTAPDPRPHRQTTHDDPRVSPRATRKQYRPHMRRPVQIPCPPFALALVLCPPGRLHQNRFNDT